MAWESSGALLRGESLVCLVRHEDVEQRRAPEVWVGHLEASRDVRGPVTELLTCEGPSPAPTPRKKWRPAWHLGITCRVQANLPEALAVMEQGTYPTRRKKVSQVPVLA